MPNSGKLSPHQDSQPRLGSSMSECNAKPSKSLSGVLRQSLHLIISFYTSSAVQSPSRVRLCEKPLDCSMPGIPASSLLLDGCDLRTVLRHRNWNHMTKQQQPYYNSWKITGSFLHDFFKQMSDLVCDIQRRVRKHCWYSQMYPL